MCINKLSKFILLLLITTFFLAFQYRTRVIYFAEHNFRDSLSPQIYPVYQMRYPSQEHPVKSILEAICPAEDRFVPAIVLASDE
jgi:hypothetical protein